MTQNLDWEGKFVAQDDQGAVFLFSFLFVVSFNTPWCSSSP